MEKLDLIGFRSGRLVVVEKDKNRNGRSHWKCSCDCGGESVASTTNLRKGHSTSCGCLRKESLSRAKTTHGLSSADEYKIWKGMKRRCENSNDAAFSDYGGRGIEVCQRWQSFENFYCDMGKRPAGMTIERINTNGNYEPENCTWATVKEQNNNRRSTVRIKINGVINSLKIWCEYLGLSYKAVHLRITRYKWSLHRALEMSLDTEICYA